MIEQEVIVAKIKDFMRRNPDGTSEVLSYLLDEELEYALENYYLTVDSSSNYLITEKFMDEFGIAIDDNVMEMKQIDRSKLVTFNQKGITWLM